MEIRRCNNCVMDDSSDKKITFNQEGNCNYCLEAINKMPRVYFPNKEGEIKLLKLVEEIKKNGEGKKYDCIMGLSGGLDSSYLAYLGYKYGLRVLLVHIDDGFDMDISKRNLEKLVEKTGFDYEIVTPNAKQFCDLTLAFMKAGVPNIAIPQDNILFAFLYKKMKQYGIKYFLSGYNFSLESILQEGNTYKNTDVVNIKDINKKFGNEDIDELIFISTIGKEIDKRIFRIKTECPLNYIDYRRDTAYNDLHDFCGFEYYGGKHLENILTAFIQLVWFPQKFGVDKRKSHLSSMIVSGQMTRDEALCELEKPIIDIETKESYEKVICDKLHISNTELQELIDAPNHQHNEYKVENDTLIYKTFKTLKGMFWDEILFSVGTI